MRARSTFATVAALAVAIVSAACGGAPQLTPDEIIAAFIAKTNDPARTYHSDLQGTYNNQGMGGFPGQNMGMTMSASFDFQGENYAGTITTNMGGGIAGGISNTVGYIKIGEVTWQRYDNSNWERTPAGVASVPATGLDAMIGLAAADVTYEAAETINDQLLHRLRVVDAAAAFNRAFDTGMGEGMGMSMGAGSEYMIYVDGEGVPVAAQSHVVGSMDFGDDLPPVNGPPIPEMPAMTFAFDFTYNYSAWGSDITILQPTR